MNHLDLYPVMETAFLSRDILLVSISSFDFYFLWSKDALKYRRFEV